jgi:hypothetical protein
VPGAGSQLSGHIKNRSIAVGMAGFKDFREIVAWQLANELKRLADALLEKPDDPPPIRRHRPTNPNRQ